MSLLAPLYLLLAAGAAVPLLIHLLRRRMGQRVDFPAARYLALAELEHRRTLRLRNLLLMLLRIAAVVFVTLAAARPVAAWLGAGHAPTALALVVDNSMSTGVVDGGRPLFDQIKDRALDVLARATPADRLWIVTADGTVLGGGAASLRGALSRLAPSAGAGDLRAALSRAAGLVRASGFDARQVAVLTDGQRTSWPEQISPIDAQVLIWCPNTPPPPNRAVTSAEARPVRWTPRGAVTARLQSTDSASVRVSIAGRLLASTTAAPGQEVTIRAAPPERGWVAGTVEVDPDELSADDIRYFAAWIGTAPGVVVGPGAGPFLASAADVLRASGQVGQGITGSNQGPAIAVVAADELTSLPAFVTAPTDPVRLGAANRALEHAGVPWRFGLRRTGAPVAVTGGSGPGFDKVDVSDRYDLITEAGAVAETLAVAGHDPWIVAGSRYVLVGSPMIPGATTFPIRAPFIPWFESVLADRLSGEPGGILEATPGARLSRPVWADAMESPDGSRLVLGDTLTAPRVAGTYFLINGARRVGALVVNAPADESILDRLTPKELEARVRGTHTASASDRDAFRALAFSAASRRSLSDPLLIAALGVLFVEGLVVTARRRDPLPEARA